MERRFFLTLFVAVGLVALSRSVVSLAAGENPPPGTIFTVAGTGRAAHSGDGGPATQAAINWPTDIDFDSTGNLFLAEGNGNHVRRISPDGIITTVAGSGKFSFSGDGGPAISAGLSAVFVSVDSADNLYISDVTNSRIRKVDTNGTITTFAGGGNPADGIGDGGPATSAGLAVPLDTAVDASGNLLICDFRHHRVRMVTPAGTITTLAGTGQAGFSGDGGPATAAQLAFPSGVVMDNAGHLYLSDLDNNRVRMVSPDGTIRTVAGGGNPADGLGDGGPATEARLDAPTQLALDGAGNLFIADTRHHRIRRVGPVGIISTVAGTGKAGFSGDGGPAAQAELMGPAGLKMDKAGNLYFCDLGQFQDAPSGFVTDGNQRIREVLGVGVPR
jgi:sugar lactone lactonase YvrE